MKRLVLSLVHAVGAILIASCSPEKREETCHKVADAGAGTWTDSATCLMWQDPLFAEDEHSPPKQKREYARFWGVLAEREICKAPPRPLDGTLQDPELVAQGKDLNGQVTSGLHLDP